MTIFLEGRFEGLESLEHDVREALDNFSQDLSYCTEQAADFAVETMQQTHPYADRTYLLSGGMHVVPGRRTRWSSEHYVEFKAPYANIVDGGSKFARPYPFADRGLGEAERKLDACVEEAMARLCTSIEAR